MGLITAQEARAEANKNNTKYNSFEFKLAVIETAIYNAVKEGNTLVVMPEKSFTEAITGVLLEAGYTLEPTPLKSIVIRW